MQGKQSKGHCKTYWCFNSWFWTPEDQFCTVHPQNSCTTALIYVSGAHNINFLQQWKCETRSTHHDWSHHAVWWGTQFPSSRCIGSPFNRNIGLLSMQLGHYGQNVLPRSIELSACVDIQMLVCRPHLLATWWHVLRGTEARTLCCWTRSSIWQKKNRAKMWECLSTLRYFVISDQYMRKSVSYQKFIELIFEMCFYEKEKAL